MKQYHIIVLMLAHVRVRCVEAGDSTVMSLMGVYGGPREKAGGIYIYLRESNKLWTICELIDTCGDKQWTHFSHQLNTALQEVKAPLGGIC